MKNLAVRLKDILGLRRSQAGPVFDLLFSRFKDVLGENNRALEIITDMGDKLGGDYLFDIAYLETAYSKLSFAVRDSLFTFDLLTQKRYPHLHGAVDRVESRIKKMLYNIATSGEMVVFYRDISWDISHEVGGKNANLAEVRNYLRLNVPDAFVITTHAFDSFLGYNGIDKQIEVLKGGEPQESALRQLRDSVLNAKIPPETGRVVEKALEEMKSRYGEKCFLAVRSSAEEEDADFSFAGQFDTRLNIPPELTAVMAAYKEVVASLFSPRAVSYQRQLGYPPGQMKMAVGCMAMVDAAVSGVMYSSHPAGDANTLLINAAWGLGSTVVEGRSDADLYVLEKKADPEIVDSRTGGKEVMATAGKERGIETIRTPGDMKMMQSLTGEQAKELARQAILIERHFRKPQDIEWAIDRKGKIFILQTRPLKVDETTGSSLSAFRTVPRRGIPGESADGSSDAKVLTRDKGVVIQRGVGAGRVFIARHPEELDLFPKGAVLVAAHDSSDYVRVMPYVSAIITDVGTPTSHMASLCREFRVPTVVNTGNATGILVHGEEITLDADGEGNATVYRGIRKELLDSAAARSARMDDLHEFRKKRYILRYIAPLNLVDPLMDDFTPEGCKTMHDIIRFIHEKSVTELVENAQEAKMRSQTLVKLDISVPAGIVVIDMGGGLDAAEEQRSISLERVSSLPLRALIKGMIHPGLWKSDTVSLKVNDFLSSMMRMSDIVTDNATHSGYNLAVVTREYLNLSLRFGYHFTTLDCYCSETARNNHIYFRFAGGATDITKRSRRISLIATVLKGYGFSTKTKGDLLTARLSNMGRDEIEVILDHLGRLIAYTRQLDAVLHDDSAVERYIKNFTVGNYDL